MTVDINGNDMKYLFKKPLDSKVPGHEGPCKPTWINESIIDCRMDGCINGFFKKAKRVLWIWWPVGEEFRGVIGAHNKVYQSKNAAKNSFKMEDLRVAFRNWKEYYPKYW